MNYQFGTIALVEQKIFNAYEIVKRLVPNEKKEEFFNQLERIEKLELEEQEQQIDAIYILFENLGITQEQINQVKTDLELLLSTI